MRAGLLASIVAVGLCAGCAAPNYFQPPTAQNTSCAGSSKEASLAPVGCTTTASPPPDQVITHPNGNGPQVETWGPPYAGLPASG
jgi:hypothetical protein